MTYDRLVLEGVPWGLILFLGCSRVKSLRKAWVKENPQTCCVIRRVVKYNHYWEDIDKLIHKITDITLDKYFVLSFEST